ncbi:hypothetical protein CEXT_337911 [Caerostris extrusa]|uniref:Uncharacterized protein n=1 Tax=Caerostris extrusa TaxID=172846 RepID=A0AAV4UKC7_CAEEX|nr:hypothetical protein CEXT_337911 [Caerostris extrusa]
MLLLWGKGGGVSAAREGARREVKRIASPDRRDYRSPPSAAFDPSGRWQRPQLIGAIGRAIAELLPHSRQIWCVIKHTPDVILIKLPKLGAHLLLGRKPALGSFWTRQAPDIKLTAFNSPGLKEKAAASE